MGVDIRSIILLLVSVFIQGNIRPCVPGTAGTLIVSQLTYVKLNKIPNIDIYFRMPTICFPGAVVVFNGFCPSLCFDARWRTEEQEGVKIRQISVTMAKFARQNPLSI